MTARWGPGAGRDPDPGSDAGMESGGGPAAPAEGGWGAGRGDPGVAPTGRGGQVIAAGSAGGSIYDLGYRGYEGIRLGRRHAVASLVRQSFRQSWGLGRPARAKIVPVGLAIIATLPAVVALGVSALANQLGAGRAIEDASPVRYDSYYPLIAQMVFLFTAAQAPELLVRDLRHRVLALYFSRAIRREDYALGKLAALGLAMLLMVLVPQALIFVGRALLAPDIVDGIREDLPDVIPVVAQAVLTAAVLAGLGLAIASFTPRRAYATAAIFAVVLVPLVATEAISELAGRDLAGIASLLSPANVLEGANDFFYGLSRYGPSGVRLPSWWYALAALAMALGAAATLVWRYRRIEP